MRLAWCGHGLEEHLAKTALLAKGDAKAVGEAVAKSERVLGVKLNERLIMREVKTTADRLAQLLKIQRAGDAVALAAYLHDVGKAISAYQLRLQSAGPGCKTSLRGHEIWSAWVAYHIAERLWDKEAAPALTAAVALHHSVRRSLDEVVLDAVKVWPEWDDVDEMFALAQRGLDLLGLELEAAEAEAAARHEWLSRKALEQLRSRLLNPAALWGELIVHVIAMADNIDSALARGEKRVAYILRPLSETPAGAP